jgi:crossover junction endodeoxyribonuclease RuvC
MIILGIDPGIFKIGYSIIEIKNKKPTLKSAGILNLKQKDNVLVLKEVKKQIDKLLKKWRPKILSIEKLFFSRNQKTGMFVAQVRGIILLSALEKNIKIIEYAPNEIKALIAGYGFADKKAVAKMVKLILKLKDEKIIDDITDAIALGLGPCQNLIF